MTRGHPRATLLLLLPALASVSALSDEVRTRWAEITKAAPNLEPFNPPDGADEWYTVTIANISVGYMNTVATVNDELASTMEVMDVQVSRGTDTSRMAFETVFDELSLKKSTKDAPEVVPDGFGLTGGVTMMHYDQRFASSVVAMNASISKEGITLVSNNGDSSHTTELPVPEEAWLGRLRARLEFARQCRAGETEIVVQTMRPELGPRVVNLSSTLTDIAQIWDGTEYVEATVNYRLPPQ